MKHFFDGSIVGKGGDGAWTTKYQAPQRMSLPLGYNLDLIIRCCNGKEELH